jgi:VCBS repeat-containing protein
MSLGAFELHHDGAFNYQVHAKQTQIMAFINYLQRFLTLEL